MLWSQAAQTTAVRAGKLFDPKSGQMLANQVVLVQGERIVEVGPVADVTIPPGAKIIDLSYATVLPGLIDGHLHLTDGVGGLQYQMMVALRSATESLKAGYTTQVVQGSHGGVQSEMFPILVGWGATPLYVLRMATTVNAEIIHWQDNAGTIEKGKFADLIATSGDPLQDITEMQRVKFMMKGGAVIKDELGAR